MKFISLFSGIGGFDLGFERAGMVSDSVCEIDKNAQNILQRHFPNSTLFDDVKNVGAKTHGTGLIDLICGGFPCQDLSVAGKRAGLAGERSGLWFEFARVIDELEPRWVVAENVPGLLSSNGGKDFAVIIRWLAERGYGVSWRVLDAQYFGVPQRRRRVFIVASLGSGRATQVLFESEGGYGNFEKETIREDSALVFTTAQTSSNGVGVSAEIAYTLDGANGQAVSGTLQANYGTKWGLGNQECGTGQYFAWDGLLRRYTPTECERLQGFPDGWTDGQADTVRYRQLGNAVAVPVVQWIGNRIMENA